MAWEFLKVLKRGMQGMFTKDWIWEITPMSWPHSLSVVRVQKENKKEKGVKNEGFYKVWER